ncbi:MAG: anthranilate phosphoribosyltransferase [Holosporales bacterium]
MTPQEALNALLTGEPLDSDTAEAVFGAVLSPELPPALAGAVVALCAARPITVDMLTGAAKAVRGKMLRISAPPQCLDTCGTGGDGQNTYNISTATALLVSACGVSVAKHGNRAVSGSVGSADVLEALGLRLDTNAKTMEACLGAHQFGFFFAPHHHPALAAIGAARRALGVRSLFNVLGVLSNPAQPAFQLIGVYAPELVEIVAHTLKNLGATRALVVHSENGLDELNPAAPSRTAELKDGIVIVRYSEAADAGLAPCTLQELRGGNAAENAAAIVGLGDGTAPRAFRDAVLYNAAAALKIAGTVDSLRTGAEKAAECLDSGAFAQHLKTVRAFLGGGNG